jgi:hypothetical protein
MCHRAWDGLRQAYAQLEIEDGARSECLPVLRLLAAFVGNTASSHDRAAVTEHLTYCDDCNAVWADLADLDTATLRTVVAPVFLGTAAAAFLSAEDADAYYMAPAGAAYEQTDTAERERRELMPGRPRHASSRSGLASRPLVWVAGVILVATAVVLALAVTRPGTAQTSAHQRSQAAGAPVPDGTTTGTPTRSPQAGATTDPASSRSPGAAAGSGDPGDPGSGGSPDPAPDPQPSTSKPSPTPEPSPSSSSSPSPAPSPTPTPTPSPSATSQAAGTQPDQSPSPSPSPSATPSPTPSPSASASPSSAATAAT